MNKCEFFSTGNWAEKRLAREMELHATFVHLRKAFDSVRLQRLWIAIKEAGINSVYVNAIKILNREN